MRKTAGRPLAQLIEQFEPFSLKKQGLLVPPERPAALLSINGDHNALVTIEDFSIISRDGIEQEGSVYAGSGHCAPESFIEHIPRSVTWLRARPTEVRRARVEREPVLAEDTATVVPVARFF